MTGMPHPLAARSTNDWLNETLHEYTERGWQA